MNYIIIFCSVFKVKLVKKNKGTTSKVNWYKLMFIYKMVQIPPNIAVQMEAHKGNEAAAYLERVVNKYASDGWEFQRVDSIDVLVKPGCMDALNGKKEENSSYYVITFRKEK